MKLKIVAKTPKKTIPKAINEIIKGGKFVKPKAKFRADTGEALGPGEDWDSDKEDVVKVNSKTGETDDMQSARHGEENELLQQAMEAEKKCLQWAADNDMAGFFKIKIDMSTTQRVAIVLPACPHKASDEAHKMLNAVREKRKGRAKPS